MTSTMRPFLTAIVALFALVALGVILTVPPSQAQWPETIKAVGVALGAATGVVAPFMAVVMVRYQQQVTGELERLKSEYASQVEILKGSLSENLELRKAEVAGQVRAFDSMLTAAHFFYFVIREQASGVPLKGDNLFVEADKKAAEASSVVWHLTKADQSIWYQVYQRSKHLAALLREGDSIATFESYAIELGEFIAQLEEAGGRIFEEARKLRLDLVGVPTPPDAPRQFMH